MRNYDFLAMFAEELIAEELIAEEPIAEKLSVHFEWSFVATLL